MMWSTTGGSVRTVFFAVLFCVVFFAGCTDPKAHQELVDFNEELTSGLTKEDVRRIFYAGAYGRLGLAGAKSDIDLWAVVTPFVLWSGNWDLYITFSDGQISATKVRTADYPNSPTPPVGAPPDRVFEKK